MSGQSIPGATKLEVSNSSLPVKLEDTEKLVDVQTRCVVRYALLILINSFTVPESPQLVM